MRANGDGIGCSSWRSGHAGEIGARLVGKLIEGNLGTGPDRFGRPTGVGTDGIKDATGDDVFCVKS